MWDSKATNRMIKSWYIKLYDRNMRPDKVEYNISSGPYCTTHDVKVPFCMPEFSRNNNEGESLIVHDIIIGCELMIQLGL